MTVNPLNPRQQFITDEVLRFEVETEPEGLPNLILNPSGEKGAWGWITPVAGTRMTSNGRFLSFTTLATQAAYFTSDFLPVEAGKYVAGRISTALVDQEYYWRARYDWYDADKALLSSSAYTSYFDMADATMHYLGTHQAPANTAYVKLRIDLHSDTSGGDPFVGTTLKFHRAMVTYADSSDVTSVRTNLVTNPSFEVDTTGWTGQGATISRSTTQAYVGSSSLRIQSTSAVETSAYVRVNVTAGRSYVFQARTRAESVARRVFIYLYPDGGGTIAGLITGINSTTGWTHHSRVWTAPPGTTSMLVKFWFRDAAVGEVHYLDAVMAEELPDLIGPTDYFDGASTNTSDTVYAWTGTPHNSTSIATSTFDYSEPHDWINILGPGLDIQVTRRSLDVGGLEITLSDPALDPAVATDVWPGKKVRLRALHSDGDWRSIYEGQIDAVDVEYVYDKSEPAEDLRPRIVVSAVDNVAVLANQAEPRGVALADLPAILEDKGVPWSVNGSGDQVASAVQISSNDNASALDQVAIARDSALGFAWVSKENVLTAYDADEMPEDVVATLSADSGLSYTEIAAGFSTASVINDVSVTWLRYNSTTGETEEVVYGPYRDQDSINAYGPYRASFTIHGAVEDSEDIEKFAEAVLAANSTPVRRASTATVAIMNQNELDLAATLDLYSLVHVDLDDLIDDDYRVTGLSHSITPTGWLMTLSFESDGTVAPPRVTPSPTGTGITSGQWIAPTLTNSWANYGGEFDTAGYRRDGNRVTLKGLVRNGTIGQPIFTLPAGYRPAATQLFTGVTLAVTTGPQSAGTAHTHQVNILGVRVDVNANGQVVVIDPGLGEFSNGYISLSGISFIAEG